MNLLIFPILYNPKLMSNMKIDVVSKELIRPSSPTPTHLRDFKLSFIDERIPHSYTPLILYYKFDGDASNIQRSEKLKTSLSDALVEFYPLAGRINSQALLECNDLGVLYVEANADAVMLDDVVKSMDSEMLDEFVPFKNNGLVSSAQPMLAVQATSFSCGGIAIGICMSHRVADGSTLRSFVKCWAAVASRGQSNNLVSPVFNSAHLFPPRNTSDFEPNSASPTVNPWPTKLAMRRFIFASPSIDALKMEASNNSCILKPTRVEVVTAFLWSRCVLAKGIKKRNKSVAFHSVNLRGKILALTEYSFGNIFQVARAEDDGQYSGWTGLVDRIRTAFGKIDGAYVEKLRGENGFEIARENFMGIGRDIATGDMDVIKFTSYCRFSIYGADFGWGRPVWVSSAVFPIKDKIFLFDSVGWSGGIEAWVVMDHQEMERLLADVEMQRFTCSSSSQVV